MGLPQEAQTGTIPTSFFFITASPIFPLTAPTPVGLGGAVLGMDAAGGGGAFTGGLNGLGAGAAGATVVFCPGLQTPGLGAATQKQMFRL